VVQFPNQAVVERYFLEPGTGFLQAGGQTVLEIQQLAEILCGHGDVINSRRVLQGPRQGLTGGGHPNGAPLCDPELNEGEQREREDEKRDHFSST